MYFYVSLDQFNPVLFAFVAWVLVFFQYQAKRLAGRKSQKWPIF